jgi:hypothetical protein
MLPRLKYFLWISMTVNLFVAAVSFAFSGTDGSRIGPRSHEDWGQVGVANRHNALWRNEAGLPHEPAALWLSEVGLPLTPNCWEVVFARAPAKGAMPAGYRLTSTLTSSGIVLQSSCWGCSSGSVLGEIQTQPSTRLPFHIGDYWGTLFSRCNGSSRIQA